MRGLARGAALVDGSLARGASHGTAKRVQDCLGCAVFAQRVSDTAAASSPNTAQRFFKLVMQSTGASSRDRRGSGFRGFGFRRLGLRVKGFPRDGGVRTSVSFL